MELKKNWADLVCIKVVDKKKNCSPSMHMTKPKLK